MRKSAAYMFLVLACLLGGGSLIVFTIFLYTGPFKLVDMGLEGKAVLWADSGLSLAFFIQHSVMIRRSFRHRMTRFVPEVCDKAFYAIASGAVLLALIVLWQEGTPVFPAPYGIARLPFRVIFCLSLLGFIWGGITLKTFDPCGIRPILARLRGDEQQRIPFTTEGPYRLVRHPLYFFCMLMIWSCPDMTTDRLVLLFFWTVWIVVGARLEENDLIDEYGEIYLHYRQVVPMFIPGLKKKRNRDK